MKKIIIITLAIVIFSGACAPQDNLTWSPTPEEWTVMSPVERNQWYLNETAARQNRNRDLADMFRSMSDSYERQLDRQYYGRPQIIFPPQNQNYWQEQLARQKLIQDATEPLRRQHNRIWPDPWENELSKKYQYNP